MFPIRSRLASRFIAQRAPIALLVGRPQYFSGLRPSLQASFSSKGDNSSDTPDNDVQQPLKPNQLRMDKPSYQLTFTCKKCSSRSSHNVTKQAYHKGTVLIQCPGCKSRHLIADHLHIFSDQKVTLEDILATKGQSITKGTIDLPAKDLEWEEAPELLSGKTTEDAQKKSH